MHPCKQDSAITDAKRGGRNNINYTGSQLRTIALKRGGMNRETVRSQNCLVFTLQVSATPIPFHSLQQGKTVQFYSLFWVLLAHAMEITFQRLIRTYFSIVLKIKCRAVNFINFVFCWKLFNGAVQWAYELNSCNMKLVKLLLTVAHCIAGRKRLLQASCEQCFA